VKLLADVAVISPEKLRDYILSPTHPDGRGKAAYLSRLGYSRTDWLRLEHDLRAQHLILDAVPGRASLYGTKYEIVGVLMGPNGGTRPGPDRVDCSVRRGCPTPCHADSGGLEIMPALFERVVLTHDLPDEGLQAGDVGVIVQHYPATAEVLEGYELEVFAASGKTLTVVSVPATFVRRATERDILTVREVAGT
jgi:hypothetical protein